MEKIEEIIQAIDDELINTGKEYLLLSQANSLLVERDIFTIHQKLDKSLKKILEENKIPHAYQTKKTPKQWRIPHSDNGKSRKRQEKTKKVVSTKYTNQYKNSNSNNTKCPNCKLNVFVPNNIKNDYIIQCLNCGTQFNNPFNYLYRNHEIDYSIDDNFTNKNNSIKRLSNKPNNSNQINNDIKLTKNQKNWVIGIIVIIVLIIIGKVSDNDSKSTNSPSLHHITTDTYAATNKSDFDQMVQYVINRDDEVISKLLLSGQITLLQKGTEVYLVSSHFSYCVVRLKGDSQKYWIIIENID